MSAALDRLSAAVRGTVAEALEAQEDEFASGFETGNASLHVLIDELGVQVQLEIGRILLQAGAPRERVLATRLLRGVRSRQADAERLISEALFVEMDVEVLAWLAAALGDVGGPNSLPVLMDLVAHPAAEVREHTAGAISATARPEPSPPAIAALVRLARDTDPQVRLSALRGMATHHRAGRANPLVESVLRGALDDDDPRARRVAAEATTDAREG